MKKKQICVVNQQVISIIKDTTLPEIKKGWGGELLITNKDYCGKFLWYNARKESSWHYHLVKDETFYVLYGDFQVLVGTIDDISQASKITLRRGDRLHLPHETRHQVYATTKGVILEISTHDDPSDVVRVTKGD